MSAAPQPQSRYEIRERLAKQGNMGVVYKAWDRQLRRFVVIKTIGDVRNRIALDHFRQEWEVLAKIAHANIVDIYDIGEMEADGQLKPFFVMPMLPGATLEQLIAERKLSTEQVVDVITQVCRGLHAAHESGVIHRDIKPSNIFVIDDQPTVKIIDFGIAHLAENTSSVGLKGTLLYMSPEQVQMRPLVPASDMFSLAVVCYEALTYRRPFEGATQEEIAYRILNHVPPPVSDFNPTVSTALAQVIQAAMAKQVHHRFSSVREFADALQKALHNRPIDRFDPKRVEPRIRKAEKALETQQIDIAAEMLAELEAEGHLQPEIRQLRRQVTQFVKDRNARQHLATARQYIEAEEYPLAMQRVQQVLDENPGHAEAVTIKALIENNWTSQQVAEWMRLAREHLDNQSFQEARKAVQSVMALRPADSQALSLLTEIGRVEEQVERVRQESAELFQEAQDAFRKGDISAALSNAEKVLDFDKLVPDKSSPGLATLHQDFYNQVRSEHDAIVTAVSDVKRLVGEKNFAGAAAVCDRFIGRYPESSQFRALRLDVDQKERQHLSAAIAKLDRETEAEPDLGRRVAMLDEALKQWPGEEHFRRSSKAAVELRDLVQTMAARARELEQRGQIAEALAQLESLRTVHPLHPGLDEQVVRLTSRRNEQALAESRARWLRQARQFLELGNYAEASRAAQSGLAEFPADAELTALLKTVAERRERGQEVERLVAEGHTMVARGEYDAGLERLARAFEMDPKNAAARTVYADSLLKRASALKESDPFQAGECVNRALAVDPSSAAAAELKARIEDRKRQMAVGRHLDEAHRRQQQGDKEGALTEVRGALKTFPGDPNLTAFQKTVEQEIARERTAPPPAPTEPPAKPDDNTRLFEPAQLPVTVPAALKPPPPPPRKMADGVKMGGLLAALVAILGLITWMVSGRKPSETKPTGPGPQQPVAVTVQVDPASARVRVDGSPSDGTSLSLAPRDQEYVIDAVLPGYRGASQRLKVAAGATIAPLSLKLEPLPTKLLIQAPMRLTVDGKEFTGQTDLLPGSHTLELTGDGAAMTINITADTGRQPAVAIQNRGVAFFCVISTLGGEGMVEVSRAPKVATIDDKPLEPAGLKMPLSGLAPGEHALKLDGGLPLKFNAAEDPQIQVQAVLFNMVSGNLTLSVTDEGAKVELSGPTSVQPQKVPKDHKVTFTNLKPGAYTVEISKDGYDTRRDQLTVVRGNNAPPAYTLQAGKAPARLTATGGIPNTRITANGRELGRVDANGQFGPANIGSGKITFLLTHDGYDSKTFTRDVSASDEVKLTREDLALVQIFGIELQNRDTRCSYRYRLKGTQAYTPGGPAVLRVSKPGMYEVECLIGGAVRGRKDIPVNDGIVATEIPISAEPVKPAEPTPVTLSLSDFNPRLAPDKESGWFKGTAQMNGKAMSGDFSFAVLVQKGLLRGKPARWNLRTATGNCFEFELTADKFGHGPCEGGKTPKPNPAKVDKGEKAQPFQIRVHVQKDSVTQQISGDGGTTWLPLDSRSLAGPLEFRFRDTTVKDFVFKGFLGQ